MAISTSSGPPGLALRCDAGQIRAWVAHGERGTADRLAQEVAQLAAELDIGVGDLRDFVVVVGPGSFTGVRAGVALAQGMLLGASGDAAVRAYPIGQLEAIAYTAAQHRTHRFETGLVVIDDARRGRAFLQVFDRAGKRRAEPSLLDVAAVAEFVATFHGCALMAPSLKAQPDIADAC
ncbi:MAG: tRNA (adenosine(37)-N6)-threonylcarbamoyltransferase complex dimerization subunit type 1 TsaB, partial [Pseudomonadota bacterium]